MSTEEFSDCTTEQLQDSFFLHDLSSRQEGCYYHYKYGLNASEGTVVLFQYRKAIVASAILSGRKRLEKPDKDGYEGSLCFDTASIRVFDPIEASTISKIWPTFPGFSQVKHSLDPKCYSEFESILKNVEAPDA